MIATSFMGDVRVALRNLMRRPLVPVSVLLVLAPALSAGALGVALVWTTLLRPLPYPAADRLVAVAHNWDGYGVGGISTALLRLYGESATTLEGLGLVDASAATLNREDGAQQVRATRVTAAGLETLGVRPALGRLPVADEDMVGAEPVVLLSHGFWTREMGADRNVLERTLKVDGTVRSVIGVLEEGLDLPGPEPDLILPAQLDPSELHLINMAWQNGIARLRPGVSIDVAEAELAAIFRRAVQDGGDSYTTSTMVEENGIRPVVQPLLEWEVGGARAFVLLLGGSVLLLLALAVSAVANLVLGRAERLRAELQIRQALGASRPRILSHFLAESVTLCALPALAGAIGALVLVRLVVGQSTLGVPRLEAETLARVALAISLGLSLVLVPFLVATRALHLRSTRSNVLRGNDRGTTQRGRLRHVLLAMQVAVSTVLLASASSLSSSALVLADAPLGFQTEGILTFQLVLPSTRYASVSDAERLHRRLKDEIESIPGVRGAGFGIGIPVADGGWGTVWEVEDRAQAGSLPTLSYRHVSEEWLEILDVPLLAGRVFEGADNAQARSVVVVNEALARAYWGEPSDALGRRLRTRSDSTWREVVGVVGNTADAGPGREWGPMLYMTLQVGPDDPYHLRYPTYVIETENAASALIPSIRERLRALDPEIPLLRVRTAQQIIRDATARERLALTGVGIGAIASLVVVAAGLAGLVLLSVLQRRREIGIRKAVGAADERLRWLLAAGVALPAGAGLAAGAVAVLAGAHVPASLLHGQQGMLSTLAITTGLLAAVIVLAGLTGSRRVSAIQPSEALREV